MISEPPSVCDSGVGPVSTSLGGSLRSRERDGDTSLGAACFLVLLLIGSGVADLVFFPFPPIVGVSE